MKKLLFPSILVLLGAILLISSFFSSSSGGSGDLEIDIEKASFIMPAAHNVYANPEALNGKYYLFKAKITNNTGSILEDVEVRYQVPGYIEWTDLGTIGEMFPGQTAAVICYPKFKEDITEKMTASMEKAEIEVTWDGASEDDMIEEEFAFRITNRNDYIFTGIPGDEIANWGDVYDNDALLACYVTPNDPIVKYYTQIVQEKVLKGDQASVSKKPEDAARFLMGLYEATRLSHMVYSGTKGVPQSLEDVSSFSQHNRLPREVITGNTGLCLELSLLYASTMSAAGIDPIIFLIPGHAYPGFRMSGQYYAIEATGIGGEGLGSIASVEDAFKTGQKQLQEFIQRAQSGDPRYTMVDVHALNQQGVIPMALKDDAFMRKKVDEIAANFQPTVSQQQPVATVTRQGGNSGGGNSGGGGGGSTVNRTRGPLSFAIPSGWQVVSRPMPDVPIISAFVVSPDQVGNATIYDVPAGNLNEAMMMITETLSYLGSQVQYNINGSAISGQSYSQNGLYIWKGKGRRTNSGFRVVAVGAPQYAYDQKSGIINSIYNSIR